METLRPGVMGVTELSAAKHDRLRLRNRRKCQLICELEDVEEKCMGRITLRKGRLK